MKKILITILLLSSLPCFAQMTPMWKNIFGEPVYSAAYPAGAVYDSQENIYVLEDVVNYNSTENSCYDPIIRKINASGETQWHRNLAKIRCIEEFGFTIKLFSGNLYMLHSYADSIAGNTKLAITKYSTSGDSIWSRILGNATYEIRTLGCQIDFDSEGNIYASGQTDGYIYKLNQSGSIIDSILITINNLPSKVYSFYITSDDKIAAISYTPESYFVSLITIHGINIWNKLINPLYPQLMKGNDNSIYEWHYRNEPLVGYFVSVNKYSTGGNLLWSTEVLAPLEIEYNTQYNIYPILLNGIDNSVILGYSSAVNLFSSTSTGRIKKLNAQTGDSIWSFNLYNVSPTASELWCITQDSFGNIYSSYRTSIGPGSYYEGNSYAVTKLNSSGILIRLTLNNGYLNRKFLPGFIHVSNNNNNLTLYGFYDGSSTFYEQSAIIRYSQPVNITPIGSSLPEKYSLKQNYPNPSNPNTVINFQIPQNSFVSLKIYDINAREVSELVNENLQAGEYKINFDGSKLPSGVYYYILTSENFSETKKMILVK